MESGAGGGNCAGVVAVTLATVRLFSGLESDFRRRIQLQQEGGRPSGLTPARAKKKVRFADDVMEPSSNNKEYRRKRQR